VFLSTHNIRNELRVHKGNATWVAFIFARGYNMPMTKPGSARRLAAIKITQLQLANRCGVDLRTISYGFANAVPRWVDLLLALEIMTAAQRQQWLSGDLPTPGDGG